MLASKVRLARVSLHICDLRRGPVRAQHLVRSTTTHAASMAKKAQPSGPRAMLWFRKGLRLHDNPALLDASQAQHLFPVFCLDPWFLTQEKVGVNRLKFLLESLEDLHASLQSRSSRLLVMLYPKDPVLKGKPEEVLPRVWKEWGITKLCFEVDTEPYAKKRDAKIRKLASEAGVEVSTHVSHTLYDTAELVERNGGTAPTTYASFQKLVAAVGEPPAPAADPPASLPTVPTGCKGADLKDAAIPSLTDLGYPDEAVTPFKGGESLALARLAEQLSDKEWVASFEKPKGNPAAFIKPATTILSPYLKFGCLSARLFYSQLSAILKTKKNHTKPPVSLVGQLLWREHFYTCGYQIPNFDRMEGNPICKQIDWDNNEEFYRAWDEARTGFPWIDAIMTQLHKQGWMHHLARHSVACFLTRGDLYVSWEKGRDTFDRLLIDSDWSINNGNWMWLSASAFFFQYYRVYSPITFGQKYDKEGAYIKHFLPILKEMPAEYIYQPWKAPLEVQRKAKCIIGQDYPAPIVDHTEIHKVNIERIKAAYSKNAGSPSGKSSASKKRKAEAG